jgi:hypothetical protein
MSLVKRKFGFFSFYACCFAATILLSAQLASAAVIGASKGVVNWENVLKNGYAQELVTLTTDTSFNLSINYEVSGDIAQWVRIEPADNPFFISKDSSSIVALIVEPPPDARIEKYTGSIRFITGALAGPDAQFGTAVRAAMNINLGLQVTGQEILSCAVPQVDVEDAEEDYSLELYTLVSNTGNVRIKPDFILEFWNQDQTRLVHTFNIKASSEILPTVQKRLFNSVQQALPIGQYWVKFSAPMCGPAGSRFFTVSVIERGGISDKGDLLAIENPVDASVGQIVPIDAVFENKGSRVVTAKFKGTVTSGGDDNIFKIIDTESLDVAPGEVARLRTYFNPTQEGQYFIKGRVLYNRKLTFEKANVINVYPGGAAEEAGRLSLGTAALIISVFTFVIVVFLVLRKKQRQKRIF